MTAVSPSRLWRIAEEQHPHDALARRDLYRQLMVEAGLIVPRQPGESVNLPCGWPHQPEPPDTFKVVGEWPHQIVRRDPSDETDQQRGDDAFYRGSAWPVVEDGRIRWVGTYEEARAIARSAAGLPPERPDPTILEPHAPWLLSDAKFVGLSLAVLVIAVLVIVWLS